MNPQCKFNANDEKIYKTIATEKFRVSGECLERLGNSGVVLTSTMLVIPEGTEVIIVKTGINSSHPDMCKAFVPSMNVYLDAISMVRSLDDRFYT
jgi:hypothetical protein